MIRLKELREERNWSMRDAAKFLKKPYMTYVNHEKGSREPNSEDLVAYAKAYGVSIDYLVGRTNEKIPTTLSDGHLSDYESAVLNASERERSIILKLLNMTPDQQEAFLTLTQSVPSGQSIQDVQEQN